jgi:hypothetical protein
MSHDGGKAAITAFQRIALDSAWAEADQSMFFLASDSLATSKGYQRDNVGTTFSISA